MSDGRTPQEQADYLEHQLALANGSREESVREANKWRKETEALQKEVDSLKDSLHDLTIQKARLEGYIDRAREADPKPEPVMVPMQDQYRGHRMDFNDIYGSQNERETPWYRR